MDRWIVGVSEGIQRNWCVIEISDTSTYGLLSSESSSLIPENYCYCSNCYYTFALIKEIILIPFVYKKCQTM